ncbi:SDR family oxidoreductase [Acinetobacter sp. ANC 4910]|uniref:SDR family oxidoreductase n=1 Tax=Acinetobacter sp. ANC 4910 TaxID=2529850 RepID=UPI00103D8E8F|nr:SDR family oxidoreductase [Acinetobacter sp. ANC 4910]TCB34327.1 SDR family oxidoreductase [Acinetobacter sp. ANC 4910]
MAKTILITGASSGLGAGMAREFAQKGYNLAICARRMERLEALKQELESQYGVQVIAKTLDVTNYDQVFEVFKAFQQDFGKLDRIIVNAGVGQGRRIGKGNFEINRVTAETNFISALAQCEAAVEIFRAQNSGHLVVISSMSAMRGLPKHLSTYAASKAAVAHLAEGIRAELIDTPIKVSTIFPGYIRTELNDGAKKLPFEVDEKTGSHLLAEAIEKAPVKAYVPKWPWLPMGLAMKVLPLRIVNKLG